MRRTPATPGRELAVAVLLVAAAVLFAAFVVAYALGASIQLLGVTLGGGLALVAAALITAGRAVVLQLVLDEQRPQAGEGDSAEAAAASVREGGEGLSRRRLLGIAGGAAAATLGAAALVPVLSAAEGKGGETGSSPWREGTPVVDEQGRPVRADQLEIGSFLTAFPEGADPRELGSPIDRLRGRSQPAAPAGRSPRLGRQRHPGLLEDLHARRLCGGDAALPGGCPDRAGAGPGLPLPLLDLRRAARRRAWCSGRPGGRCRSCRCGWPRTARSRPPGRCRAPSARPGGG